MIPGSQPQPGSPGAEKREARRQRKEDAARIAARQRLWRRVKMWAPAAGIVAGTVVLLIMLAGGTAEGPAVSTDALAPQDHIKGSAAAPVVVIEYSDFQCPACKQYYPIVKRLAEEFGEGVAMVYRHFPLDAIHANARPAAWAAEAAARQDAFWQMHDMLFEHQDEWARVSDAEDLFASYAAVLGLDAGRFAADYASDEVRARVGADRDSAARAQLTGTPSFFINGIKINNPRGYEDFRSIIQAAAAAGS